MKIEIEEPSRPLFEDVEKIPSGSFALSDEGNHWFVTPYSAVCLDRPGKSFANKPSGKGILHLRALVPGTKITITV